jgi:acetoacetyl-CoA synthetase
MSISTSTPKSYWHPSQVRAVVYVLLEYDIDLPHSGGTDICSLFAGICSALPVYRGEIQCRMLGMAIESYTSMGTLTPTGEAGDLVCLKPFPCMPVGFWPLPGFGKRDEVEAAKARYQQTYFSEFKGAWCKLYSSYAINLMLRTS